MFRKLRNKLILINLGVTSAVIVVMFSTIYVVSSWTAERRLPAFGGTMRDPAISGEEMSNVEVSVNLSVREERRQAANQLLILLIISGVAIEIIVAIVSYFLAEEAIKPVREAYESQKIFIANASHEIKTPLAAISANLEAADIHGNRWIDNIENETAHLTRLNNELLTLARTDLVRERKVEEVDLADVTEKIIKNHAPRLKKHNLTKKIVSREKIKINREDYEQVINILLDNAIKYSKSKIMIELSDHDFVIKNDGAKISAEALTHIFDRFYQADKTSEGVGLGLSIAKSVADRNHWKILVSSDEMTIFILQF